MYIVLKVFRIILSYGDNVVLSRISGVGKSIYNVVKQTLKTDTVEEAGKSTLYGAIVGVVVYSVGKIITGNEPVYEQILQEAGIIAGSLTGSLKAGESDKIVVKAGISCGLAALAGYELPNILIHVSDLSGNYYLMNAMEHLEGMNKYGAMILGSVPLLKLTKSNKPSRENLNQQNNNP